MYVIQPCETLGATSVYQFHLKFYSKNTETLHFHLNFQRRTIVHQIHVRTTEYVGTTQRFKHTTVLVTLDIQDRIARVSSSIVSRGGRMVIVQAFHAGDRGSIHKRVETLDSISVNHSLTDPRCQNDTSVTSTVFESKDKPTQMTKQSFTIIDFITYRKSIHFKLICKDVHS